MSLLLALAVPAFADTFEVDNGHTSIVFSHDHLGVSNLYGVFTEASGTFEVKDGAPDKIVLEIKADSVDTRSEKRDDHLKGPDFLDAGQFPVISFTSSKVTPKGDDYEVTGTLSLHGVEKEITVTVQKIGEGADPWGGYRAGYETTFTVPRTEYGMTYMSDGASDVKIIAAVEGIRK